MENRPDLKNERNDLTDKDFYQQACAYFYYHAEQRTTMINFFIAVFAACIALYGSLLSEYPVASMLIAVFLFIVSLLFYFIDRRNRFDVKQSQNVIGQIERFYGIDKPLGDKQYAFGVFSNEDNVFKYYNLKCRKKEQNAEYRAIVKLYKKTERLKNRLGSGNSRVRALDDELTRRIDALAAADDSISRFELVNSIKSGSVISLSFSIKMLYYVCIIISLLAVILGLFKGIRII